MLILNESIALAHSSLSHSWLCLCLSAYTLQDPFILTPPSMCPALYQMENGAVCFYETTHIPYYTVSCPRRQQKEYSVVIKVLTPSFYFMQQCCNKTTTSPTAPSVVNCSSLHRWLGSGCQLVTRWISVGREIGEMALWGTGHCYLNHKSVSGISENNNRPKVKVDTIVDLSMEEK